MENEFYPVGEVVAMNRLAIEEREAQGKYVSDGEAILMSCQYLVNPDHTDHPSVHDRQYVWVSFSWQMAH